MRGGSPASLPYGDRAYACVFPVRGGSPVVQCIAPAGVRVSSPCAGVHRWHDVADGVIRACLPRARGFTGLHACGTVSMTRVFPVRGGSPTVMHRSSLTRSVSSPCAGVHRIDAVATRSRSSVFPVRGGSPTVTAARQRDRACVFPVRGGSPSTAWLIDMPYACVFPVRGGSPILVDAHRHRLDVSSPCAGVHRPHRRAAALRLRVFPVRGGSPTDVGAMIGGLRVFPVRGGSPMSRSQRCAGQCLPRARGFTDHVAVALATGSVFPVRGGSPPYDTSCDRSERRVFPVRGGSPMSSSPSGAGTECLPRARGFTAYGDPNVADQGVSSPRAGVHRLRAAGKLS